MLEHPDFKHEILSESQTYELFLKMKNDDTKAKDKLILYNLRLVLFIARKFDNTGIELEELVNVGSIGLIKAINSFKVDKNIKFTTYSTHCIQNEILMYLRKLKRHINNVSIYNSISENNNGELLKIEDKLIDNKPIAEDIITRKAEYELLKQLIEELPIEQKQIVKLYFGFDGQSYRQKEIAEITGISCSYVSKIVKDGVEKIKKQYLKNI